MVNNVVPQQYIALLGVLLDGKLHELLEKVDIEALLVICSRHH